MVLGLKEASKFAVVGIGWDNQTALAVARLNAFYFHLYGLSRGDAAYVLDTPSSAAKTRPPSAAIALRT